MAFFHWGIHGWIVYTLVGLVMAFVGYRKGLPMTIRSCFHPILGDRVFGIIGDVIDIISVISTMFGVATSLGFGVMTLNSGLNRMNSDIEENTNNQIIITWVVTCIATISVVSGLKLGIRYLSEVSFVLGLSLMMFVFFHDNTWFFLNLYVQSLGYYFQWFIQNAFHTDAFAQLGNAPDGKEEPTWMADWTVFSWGWWITWAPFVGMFIAKISRGRTVRNFINATIAAPILYIFCWFTIFGGAGLKMERDAAVNGINCTNFSGVISGKSSDGLIRLSCRPESEMYFDVIEQYGENLGGVLRIISLIAALLYFVTSSDSGSLVIDCLSANGNPDPPVIQRIFWAFTEGACVTALLKTGGHSALTALQTVSMASGLLYAIVINLMCFSLWRSMQIEAGDYNVDSPKFSSGLVSAFDFPSCKRSMDILIAIVAPWWPAGQAAAKVYNMHPVRYMVIMAVLFYGWILIGALQFLIDSGLAYISWIILCGFFAYVVSIRLGVRLHFDIEGSVIIDCLVVVLFYPLAIDQIHQQMLQHERNKAKHYTHTSSFQMISIGNSFPPDNDL